MTTALKEGTYYGACKPNMVGQLKGVTQLTVTAGAEVAVSEDEAKLREEAVTKYTAYVRDQAGQLLTATQDFVTAYLAGDTAKAQSLYPLARQHYERIEPTAESFGLEQAGDIDEALDARIQDLATDARRSSTLGPVGTASRPTCGPRTRQAPSSSPTTRRARPPPTSSTPRPRTSTTSSTATSTARAARSSSWNSRTSPPARPP